MDPVAALELLAHAGPHSHGKNSAALAVIALAAMVVPFVLLGLIGRWFIRSRNDGGGAVGER